MGTVFNVIGELTTTGRFIPYLMPMAREFHEQKQHVGTVYDTYEHRFKDAFRHAYENNRRYTEERCYGEAPRHERGTYANGTGRPFFNDPWWFDPKASTFDPDRVKTAASVLKEMEEAFDRAIWANRVKAQTHRAEKPSAAGRRAAKRDAPPKINEPWYGKHSKGNKK